MGIPPLPKFYNYAYDTDLIIDQGTPYTGSVRTRIDPENLSVGSAQNDASTNDVNLPIPLIFGKKKRGLWPRHVVLAVTDQGATKSTITKIPILTPATAAIILTLGPILLPDAFEYTAYTGELKLVGYAQEYYFRIFEEVESSSPNLVLAQKGVESLENSTVIPSHDVSDFAKEYERRQRELNDWYQRAIDARMADGG